MSNEGTQDNSGRSQKAPKRYGLPLNSKPLFTTPPRTGLGKEGRHQKPLRAQPGSSSRAVGPQAALPASNVCRKPCHCGSTEGGSLSPLTARHEDKTGRGQRRKDIAGGLRSVTKGRNKKDKQTKVKRKKSLIKEKTGRPQIFPKQHSESEVNGKRSARQPKNDGLKPGVQQHANCPSSPAEF